MADIVSAEVRSRMMSGIRSKNTKPELLIRRGLHALGFRFRLHVRGLPGTPDLVLARHRAVIFVHGCFWHGHDCHLFRLPSTRTDFWRGKITRNQVIDAQNQSLLDTQGWRQGIVWECAMKGKRRLPLETVLTACASWLVSKEARFEIKGA